MKKRKTRKSQGNIAPLVLIGVGVLFLLAVVLIIVAQSAPSGAAADTDRISLQQAKAAFDSQEAVFLDVRDAESYNASHIPGAVNIPLAMLENQASSLDPNRWIITYCT